MTQANFWDDSNNANKLMRELKYLKNCVGTFENGFKRIEEYKELVEVFKEDPEMLEQIQQELLLLDRDINIVEIQSILGGPFDKNNVIFLWKKNKNRKKFTFFCKIYIRFNYFFD